MKKIHQIQLNILRKLLFSEYLRHSDLREEDIPNSQLKFHLDEMIKENLVEKSSDGYSLTIRGKEFANRMHTKSNQIQTQAKITTILICTRIQNNQTEYLIYTRLKNPFYNHQGFPTKKAWWGDKIAKAAKQGLKEETDLAGTPELIAIRHYHVYFKKDIIEDKIMYIYRFTNPVGKLRGINEGRYEWIPEKDLRQYITHPLPEFRETLEIAKAYSGQISFVEKDQHVTVF